ncbi:hypothetical protein [Streptomyces sp. NPDC060065]|uniref:hypothetical protein n=1 Tax=Streptomyces sp. NPDC060065 TaxID=3347050 RepID=UPI0036C43CF0
MHHALLNVRADIAAARGDYPRLLAEPETWGTVASATGYRLPATGHRPPAPGPVLPT